MMDFVSIILVAFFGLAVALASGYYLIKAAFQRKYFNKDSLREYEEDIAPYNFSLDDDVLQIANKMQMKIKYERMRKEAYIDDQNPSLIHVNKKLDTKHRNFAITHELGHSLRGYTGKVAKNKNRIISKFIPEEQICDYYSAAILLPQRDLRAKMLEYNFEKKGEDAQMSFIRRIAEEKDISEDVVYRRICELSVLYS